jgi:hypothetical protein
VPRAWRCEGRWCCARGREPLLLLLLLLGLLLLVGLLARLCSGEGGLTKCAVLRGLLRG